MNTEPKKSKNIIIIVLSIIAFILITTIVIQRLSSSKNKLLTLENEQVKKEIREARVEINRYKGISKKLDEVVNKANTQIAEQEKKISRIFAEKTVLQKENAMLSDEIREIKEDYLEVIDSLLVERGINSVLNSKIEELEDEIGTLSEKVGVAELMVIENTKVMPLKESTFGSKRQTAMAKKATIVKVCFDILENKVIAPGFQDIYLRIISPDANVLKEDDETVKTFVHPVYKKKAEYSRSEIVNYKNEKISMCISFQSAGSLKTGLYLVELFTENQKLGTTTFTLK